jgi:hypothetical protein
MFVYCSLYASLLVSFVVLTTNKCIVFTKEIQWFLFGCLFEMKQKLGVCVWRVLRLFKGLL